MTILERLEDLRGEAYFDEWRRIWLEIREGAIEAAEFIKAEEGCLTTWDLVDLCDLLETPFKPLVLALEGEGVIGRGSYAGLQAQGFSVLRARENIAAWRGSEMKRNLPPLRREGELTSIWDLLQEELSL